MAYFVNVFGKNNLLIYGMIINIKVWEKNTSTKTLKTPFLKLYSDRICLINKTVTQEYLFNS